MVHEDNYFDNNTNVLVQNKEEQNVPVEKNFLTSMIDNVVEGFKGAAKPVVHAVESEPTVPPKDASKKTWTEWVGMWFGIIVLLVVLVIVGKKALDWHNTGMTPTLYPLWGGDFEINDISVTSPNQ
jgi:hypothetical protein